MTKRPQPTAVATPSAVPRETRYDGPDAIAVIWPDDDPRGLLRIGDFRRGVAYVLQPDAAIRLVDVKRFRYASPADAAAAADHIEQRNAAALAPSPAAAATGEGGGTSMTQDEE